MSVAIAEPHHHPADAHDHLGTRGPGKHFVHVVEAAAHEAREQDAAQIPDGKTGGGEDHEKDNLARLIEVRRK